MARLTSKRSLFILTVVTAILVQCQALLVFASNATTFSQVISDGALSVDIVDGSAVTVGSPAVTFGGLTFSFSTQTATGTLGAASQKIRVFNPTSTATWSVSIAATGGATALWTTGSVTYDFNDSNTDGTDDADTDTKGGRLTVDPSVSTVAGVPDNSTCSPSTGITKGSSASFKEVATAVTSITLLSGGGSATPYCRWDMTGVGLSQVIPPSQVSGTYTLSFTITIA